ncbi:uncharacterized protein LOC111046522 [Nilaparvata lugens]|uniref:uncharacterized protein LOC111046522 n=1 Tax=Nilaparvata lugens TaxID=108931 RepID=UPI000B98BD99|nr:uncharacterized protein LOC111046522 [Nilaparvata lugens]
MDDKGVVADEDCPPSLRICTVARPQDGSCGFHLSRTTWDPYPWISEVETGSAAESAGLQVGDCVLEVNGEDVLGLRIGEVALKVYSRDRFVKLLLWNAGSDSNGTIWLSGGSGPTPMSLQRLAVCLQSVVQLLECPVCLETAPPPAYQCCNGHLLCSDCRANADRCPVCRVQLGSRGRCLVADKLHALLTSTFFRECHPKKRRGALRSKAVPRLKLKSRLPSIKLQEELESVTGKHINAPLFHCPAADCTEQLSTADLLLKHIQHIHEGPLVQYFPKHSSVSLYLPISPLTLINTRGLQIFVRVIPQKTDHLVVWLWAVADPETVSNFRFRLTRPDASPYCPVQSLTQSATDILLAENFISIDKPATGKLDLTISQTEAKKCEVVSRKIEE